jgi:hypothetical protein
MNTPDLLTHYETCDLKGFWSRDWKRPRLTPNEFLIQGMTAGLIESEREDIGELAGETVMDLAVNPGMETPASKNIHESVVHHATLADILTTAVRRPGAHRWLQPTATVIGGHLWHSGAFLDPSGTYLRRLSLVSSWNDERHYSEMRSWYSLGEVAAYNLPMKVVVLVLGQHRDGRRHGPFSKGFLHPQNKKLRFRKRAAVTSEVFSDKWAKVWREERDEITTKTWLEAMLEDDILRDVCFVEDLPIPPKVQLERIRDMAARKLDRLAGMKAKPEASMSVCDRPACQFKGCCWSEKLYEPSGKSGFVLVQKIGGDFGGGTGGNAGQT